jgi:mRNA interferase RelE/StbE
VRIREDAQKQLDKLSEPVRKRIVRVIIKLQEEPRPQGVRKIVDSVFWRIRVGRFRVIYTIDDERQIIIIVRVSKRDESTYENLWN